MDPDMAAALEAATAAVWVREVAEDSDLVKAVDLAAASTAWVVE
jgi:hypothetical protein